MLENVFKVEYINGEVIEYVINILDITEGIKSSSLDVKFLFTNVPIKSVLDCLENWLHCWFYITDIEAKEFIYLNQILCY